MEEAGALTGAAGGAGLACRSMVAPGGCSDRQAGTYGRLGRPRPHLEPNSGVVRTSPGPNFIIDIKLISHFVISNRPPYPAEDRRCMRKRCPRPRADGQGPGPAPAEVSSSRPSGAGRPRRPGPGHRPALPTPAEAVLGAETVTAPPAAGGWPAPGRTLKAENLAAIHARAAASIAPPTLRPPPCPFPARRVVHGRSRGGQRSPPPCRGNEAGRPPAMAQDLAGVVVDAAR